MNKYDRIWRDILKDWCEIKKTLKGIYNINSWGDILKGWCEIKENLKGIYNINSLMKGSDIIIFNLISW